MFGRQTLNEFLQNLFQTGKRFKIFLGMFKLHYTLGQVLLVLKDFSYLYLVQPNFSIFDSQTIPNDNFHVYGYTFMHCGLLCAVPHEVFSLCS